MYLFSTPDFFEREVDVLTQFFKSGLRYFHLRKKNISDARLFLSGLPVPYHQFITVHQHIDLLDEFSQLRGFHLTSLQRASFLQNALQKMERRLQGTGKVFSTGFHTLGAVNDCKNICFDYAFLSPVFDSISKQNYSGKNFDITNFKRSFPLIALGGMTPENQKQALQLGFDDVAVLGAVWLAKDPVKIFQQFIL